MIAPARKIEKEVNLPVRDAPLPEPANDNIGRERLASYVRQSKSWAGDSHVPAAAKMWWLP